MEFITMMEQILPYILFVLGFVLLVKGADWLVEGTASIAKKFNISDIIIGLTVVSLGTSMPELIVNLLASFSGSPDLAIGNILGSNVANILLILGVTAIISPLVVNRNTMLIEIPFSLTAALLFGFLANANLKAEFLRSNLSEKVVTYGLELNRVDGIILLIFFLMFMLYIFKFAQQSNESPTEDHEEIEILPNWKAILYIVVGGIGLALGGDWIVEGAKEIASQMGISQSVVALTIVAIGTSLPELAASAVAAFKNKTDIAIGNAVGSNIFNVLWILGLSATIAPLPFQEISNLDVAMIIFASMLLLIVLAIGKQYEFGKKTGIFFLLVYTTYVVMLVNREQDIIKNNTEHHNPLEIKME